MTDLPRTTPPNAPRPRAGILDIAPYKGGVSALAGQEHVVKLSSNESPWGPPPLAQQAAADAASKLNLYPSGDHRALRAALADKHGIETDRIICGNGSGDVLALTAQAYAGAGDEIIYTEHGFSMYPIYAKAVGATGVVVPERNRCVDVDAILAAITERTRVIYVTNPGNPTGTRLDRGEVERLAENVPPHVVLVLDGAYAEFGEDDGSLALAGSRPNVIVTRTFSKAYGLGGMRVGWGYAAQGIIDVLLRIRGPFNLSVPALAAAEGAVRDADFVAATTAKTIELREKVSEQLRAIGLSVDPSHANFILVRFDDEAQAQACNAALNAEGIIVRPVAGYGFPEALRITIGDEATCARVVQIITDFKARA